MGLVGGALLVIGSLMTWASVSINVANIAQAVGIDPSAIPAGTFPGTQTVSGSSLSDGKIALVCGIVALIAAVLIIMATGRTLAAVLLIVGGLAGGGIALYDGLNGKDDAVSEGVKQLTALGVPGDVKSFFDVSIGIGIWICVVGGFLAIVAGILSLRGKPPAAVGMSSGGAMGSGMSTGVAGSSEMPSGMSTPATPATPAAPPTPPAPPMDLPDPGSAPPTS